MELASITMLLKVLFSFLLLFVLLPSLFIRFDQEGTTVLDRLFIPLIHSTVFFLVVVHLLVALRIFEPLSIILVSLAGAVYFLNRRKPGLTKAPGQRMLSAVYDLFETKEDTKRILLSWVSHGWRGISTWSGRTKASIRQNAIPLILILLTLAYAAYTRFKHVLVHYYFASSDPYVHMIFTKFLQKNVIFVEGVIPFGFQVVMATISRFFLMDLYDIARFIGPISGFLIVLSIGYAVSKLRNHSYAIFVAMFVYSFFSFLPTYLWRQLSALPMEYGLVFMLPGIVFWLIYCRSGGRRNLLLAAECLFITVMMHPFTAIVHAICIVIIGLVFVVRIFKRGEIWRAAASLVLAGLLGIAPIMIAMAVGVPFVGSGYVDSFMTTEEKQTKPLFETLIGWMTFDEKIITLSIAGIAAIFFIVYIRKRSVLSKPAASLPTILLVFVVLFVLLRAEAFGIPPFYVPNDRFGVMFAVFASFFLGVLFTAIGRITEYKLTRPYVSGFLSIVVVSSVFLSGYTLKAPVGDRYQYDEAVETYIHVRDTYDYGNWTIVSPVDEYPLVEAFGYHTNLWEFVRDMEPGSTARFGFPTEHVFFYVEMDPLYGEGMITPEDAKKPMPVANISNLTDFYYRSDNRMILEAKLYNWATWYMKEHPDKMSLFVDTPYFKVFHLQQEAKVPAIELPHLPENMVGIW